MAAVSQRFLNLIITGENLSGPAISSLGGDLTSVARVSNMAMGSMNKSTGLLSQQLYILRRSFEYAVAGMGLYKIYEAINAWKTYRSELGQLNTTLDLSGKKLTAVGQMALNVASQTGQSITNTLQSFQNVAQQYGVSATGQRLPTTSIVAFSKIEDEVANAMQATPADVGSTVGAIATAMYGRNAVMSKTQGPKLIAQIAAMVLQTQKRAGLPNASGEEILTAMQNLIGGSSVGRFTFPQTLSMFDVIEKQLASPSKASLYLRQLESRIITPTTAESAYYAQAGLPSGEELQGMTGQQILTGLVKAVISQPGTKIGGKLAGANAFQEAVAAGFKNVDLGAAGRYLLEKAIGGRLQSGIAANLIVQGFGQIAGLQSNLYGGIQPGSTNPKAVQVAENIISQAQAQWAAQNELTIAGTRISVLSTQLIDNLNPLIQHTAKFIGDVAQYITDADKYTSEGSRWIDSVLSKIPVVGKTLASYGGGGILEAVLGVGALKGVGKLVGAVRSSDWLEALPLLKKLSTKGLAGEGEGLLEQTVGKTMEKVVQGPLDVAELKSALLGTANGSPEAPFWVVISPLSLQTIPFLASKGGGYGSSLPTNDKQKAKSEAEKIAASVGKKAESVVTSKGGILAEGALIGEEGVTRGSITKALIATARAALKGTTRDITEGFGITGYLERNFAGEGLERLLGLAIPGLDIASLGAMALAGAQGGTVTAKIPKGSVALQGGGWARAVKANSLAALIGTNKFSGGMKEAESLLGAPNESIAEKVLKALRTDPAVQQDLMKFVSSQISSTTLNNLLKQAVLGQQTQFFTSKAGIPSGVIIPDSVSATFYLQPTQELQNMLKPQKVRGKVPLKYVTSSPPAPTSKGNKPTLRTQ